MIRILINQAVSWHKQHWTQLNIVPRLNTSFTTFFAAAYGRRMYFQTKSGCYLEHQKPSKLWVWVAKWPKQMDRHWWMRNFFVASLSQQSNHIELSITCVYLRIQWIFLFSFFFTKQGHQGYIIHISPTFSIENHTVATNGGVFVRCILKESWIPSSPSSQSIWTLCYKRHGKDVEGDSQLQRWQKPSSKLTWQWKISIFSRRYIFKWLFSSIGYMSFRVFQQFWLPSHDDYHLRNEEIIMCR